MDTTTDATSTDTAQQLRQVADLIAAGATREARRRTGRIADAADPDTRALLAEILTALENPPSVMLDELRKLWKCHNALGRELIEACAPRPERRAEAATQTARAVRATRAERRDYERRKPRDLVTRQGIPRQRRSQHTTDQDAAARRYFAGRVDPTEDTDDQTDYEQLDYDRAAVPPMRGLPCVACGVERPTRDQQRTRDDGLCEDCRDSGTSGVPILPATATRADVLAARCDYIAATSHTTAERNARLNRDWRCLRTADRFTIADWHTRQPS
ncbi:hypothetical protein AD006_31545 (plasmid) [Pseudonocardia sp. EC080610-09]|uniref:hypothetical protein n=1 Tax=unclassified Pseudonocardia TaxID=2619320 RepID=UPI000706C2DD|nr:MULTISPECIES: hypothetical protein [unclassified Pseudonocardia]ALL79693.1 hypothetical protein AD006_31545 [Pseudonocardia sp. EC080610-09]ALL85353.1 hypothetical protein AD017_29705 [Pseudonocardia sp. EC080619-01]